MSRFYIIAASLLLLAATSTLSFAQSRRMVVVEELTNASCPPCAAQNPTYEKYLKGAAVSDNVISITYHGWWPGRDVMYDADTSISRTRVPYYGITGAPTAVVQGNWYFGTPSDTSSIAGSVETIADMISPITMHVSESRNGSDVTVNLQMISTQGVSGTVHVVVVEEERYYANAGTNGEKHFPTIARRMLPSPSGQRVNLAAGEAWYDTLAFAIDPLWNADSIHVVAFIQADNKEILQGAISVSASPVEFATIGRRAMIQQGTGPGEWSQTVHAEVAGTYTLRLSTNIPAGWTAAVQIDGENVADGEQVPLGANSDVSWKVVVDPTAGTGVKAYGSVAASLMNGTEVVLTRTYRLYGSGLQAVVLQRHLGDPVITNYYDLGLGGGIHRYAIINPADEDLFDYGEYVTIMEVGKWALEVPDIAFLKSQISKGSRIYLIGAEIGFGLADPLNTDATTPRDLPFLKNQLHAGYTRDANPSATVSGIAGDPVGDGLTFSIKTGVQNQDTPDEFTVEAGALPCFYYGTNQSQVAGLRYADSRNRLVFLGFGAEGIGDLPSRTALLKQGITWLLGSDVTSSVDRTEGLLARVVGAVRPNPTTGGIELPLRLNGPTNVRVDLFDLQGTRIQRILERIEEGGDRMTAIDLSGVPSGSYVLSITIGNEHTSRWVTVAR